jgi:hypothetical protein
MQATVDPSLLAESVSKVLAVIATLPADNRLAYTESEAAQMLGVADHVLRDVRLRGEIRGKKVGKRWMYPKDTLIQFLAS